MFTGRSRVVLLACLAAGCASSSRTDVVHHPPPKEPVYVSAAWYEEARKQIPVPPQAGSAEQKSDEAMLLSLQASRGPEDCRKANVEVMVTLQNLFGQPNGPIEPTLVAKLKPFFDQLRNDGDYFIQKMKKDFPRPRPFTYLKLSPCVPREVTGAYPSGHATLSRLYALILADLFPQHRQALEARGVEIGKHRVLSGMHHPTDVAAGRSLAALLYAELKKSERYRKDLEAAPRR